MVVTAGEIARNVYSIVMNTEQNERCLWYLSVLLKKDKFTMHFGNSMGVAYQINMQGRSYRLQ